VGRRPCCALLVLTVVTLSGCTLGDDGGEVDPAATVVELPGAAAEIDFHDIAYSAELQRVLVAARDSGVYLVEPDTAEATRVEGPSSVDSVDAGEGVGHCLIADEVGHYWTCDANAGRILRFDDR
jgi:hypothetical protein